MGQTFSRHQWTLLHFCWKLLPLFFKLHIFEAWSRIIGITVLLSMGYIIGPYKNVSVIWVTTWKRKKLGMLYICLYFLENIRKIFLKIKKNPTWMCCDFQGRVMEPEAHLLFCEAFYVHFEEFCVWKCFNFKPALL